MLVGSPDDSINTFTKQNLENTCRFFKIAAIDSCELSERSDERHNVL
jgi:hypothetical protein